MAKRGVDDLLRAIANLPPADRQRLVTELTRGARLPSAGGRQPLAKTARAAVALAKRLSRRGLSLRRISAKLTEVGHLNERGQPYNAQSIRAMLTGPQKRIRATRRPPLG
jgi:hypothetical protein